MNYRKLFDFLLDLIYPSLDKCFICGRAFHYFEVEKLCSSCLKRIIFVEEGCKVCGRSIEGGTEDFNNLCRFCNKTTPYFDQARSIGLYRGLLKELIHSFKYHKDKIAFIPAGAMLSIYYKHYFKNKKIDYLIPVPLHPTREKDRGYNQAALLAKEIAKDNQLEVREDLIIRNKVTRPLYYLNRYERQAELSGVFSFIKMPTPGLIYLLVDDIFTTGTTVNELSQLLKSKGQAKKVYVLSFSTGKVI